MAQNHLVEAVSIDSSEPEIMESEGLTKVNVVTEKESDLIPKRGVDSIELSNHRMDDKMALILHSTLGVLALSILLVLVYCYRRRKRSSRYDFYQTE